MFCQASRDGSLFYFQVYSIYLNTSFTKKKVHNIHNIYLLFFFNTYVGGRYAHISLFLPHKVPSPGNDIHTSTQQKTHTMHHNW